MAELKHTAGPWFIATQGGLPVVITEGGTKIADPIFARGLGALRQDPAYQQEIAANARLIASAPDLLDALKAIIDCWRLGGRADQFVDRLKDGAIIDDAECVIAKAEGRQ